MWYTASKKRKHKFDDYFHDSISRKPTTLVVGGMRRKVCLLEFFINNANIFIIKQE